MFPIAGTAKSTCLIYLSDNYSELSLAGSYGPAADDSVIKDKKGDIFSQWALAHTQPLLVEDTSSDFRFDKHTVKKTSQRKNQLLDFKLSHQSKQAAGNTKFRLTRKKALDTEDLRLLNTIADIASIAIDNAKCYQT